jgi:hypothetical protein
VEQLPDRTRRTDEVSPELMASWQARLAQALPFYYGWVIFAVSGGIAYSAHPLMAVATL